MIEIRSYRRVFDSGAAHLPRRSAAAEPRRCAGARGRLLPGDPRGGTPDRRRAAAARRSSRARCRGICAISRCPRSARDRAQRDPHRGPAVPPRCARAAALPGSGPAPARWALHASPRRLDGAGIRRRSCCCPTARTAACAVCATRVRAPCWSPSSTSAAGATVERARRAGLARWGRTRRRSARRPRARPLTDGQVIALARGVRLLVRGRPSASARCRREGADRVRVRQLRVRAGPRRRLGGIRGGGVLVRMAERGRQACAASSRCVGALEALEADVQILRVARRWQLERYARRAGRRGRGPQRRRTPHRRAREPLRGRSTLGAWSEIGPAQPVVFLLVSLRDPERDVASYVSQAAERHPREWLGSARARSRCATGAC